VAVAVAVAVAAVSNEVVLRSSPMQRERLRGYANPVTARHRHRCRHRHRMPPA
jgi:hypothetical protein